VSFEKSLLAN